MSQIIEAIYEEGVLKPLEPLDVTEHTKVKVQISQLQGLTLPPEIVDTAERQRLLKAVTQRMQQNPIPTEVVPLHERSSMIAADPGTVVHYSLSLMVM